jgi:hypothetical protein
MSDDGVTVAEIVEHAYRCGAVAVTNYRDVDGLAIETFELVGGKPVVAGTEYVTDTEYGDEVWASFTNETRVSIRLQFGQVGEVRVAPGLVITSATLARFGLAAQTGAKPSRTLGRNHEYDDSDGQ